MDFIEGRIDIEPWQLPLLAGLLGDLNLACRTAFARSLRSGTDPKAMAVPWAKAAGCFDGAAKEGLLLTSHQEDMAVRKAKGLRKTANAKAEWLAGHHAKMAKECSKAIDRALADLSKLDAQLDRPSPLAKPSLRRKLRLAIAKAKLGLASMRGRHQRLLASSERFKGLSESGIASMVFGGVKLARQGSQLDAESSPFACKADWDLAWTEARSQSWLFEGAADAACANKGAKMDLEEGILRVRLTDWQALERMEALAEDLGLDNAKILGSAKYCSQRMECRYLALKLDLSGQPLRLAGLRAALTPSDDPKHKGKTPPCPQPVSWRIWIEGDVAKPESCKVYARAMWKAEDAPSATFGSNGCLGVDVNAWGVALAWCDPEGNKPAKGQPYRSDLPIDWTGSSEHALHEIRIAAKAIVDGAAALGCPLCLEALDFSDLKRRLRYEASREQAKLLSSFAYGRLLEAILARAAKMGVEVRWVDPSWTSLVGWAKYGSAFGLGPDQAAAFCVARKGALSGRRPSHMRRGKVLGEWVDLHAKPEQLDGLKSKAGWASAPKAAISKNEDPKPATAAEQGGPATTRQGFRRRRSTPSGTPSAERRLALALGTNRKLWPSRLSLSAKERTLESRSIAQGDLGKAVEGGETSLPAEISEAGPRPPSTD